jgi:predicted transcriptional regulator
MIQRQVLKALEGLGLIAFEKVTVGGRDRIKPIARYDRIVLDFDLEPKQASTQ